MVSKTTTDKVNINNDLKPNRSQNHDIEVWVDDPSNSIIIAPGDSKEININRNPKGLKVYLKTKDIPSKGGLRGVKIKPGWYPGELHHIETVIKGTKLFSVLHYDPHTVKEGDKEDRDPTIIHPDDPEQ